jgi:site-specific recombinase XerD
MHTENTADAPQIARESIAGELEGGPWGREVRPRAQTAHDEAVAGEAAQRLSVLPRAVAPVSALPPVLAGSLTPEVGQRVEGFYGGVAEIFERWVGRCRSEHTRRSYREGVMAFVRYLGLSWPAEASALLRVSVADVQAFRDGLADRGAAPKTLNHRVSALSSFYRYLALCAAELRLPILVPNPAHAQFIARSSSDPREETLALPAALARQLLNGPTGDAVLDYRDRAIVKLYLYTGIRLAAGCRLEVGDFRQDGAEATLRLREKGDKRRTIGLHYAAAQALQQYIERAALTSGPLFRPRRHARLEELGSGAMHPRTMWCVLKSYLEQLPNALRERELPDGRKTMECVYTPHSLRATAATLLLDSRVDIMEVKELLGHRHVTTTQIYDKRRRAAREGASHKMPL